MTADEGVGQGTGAMLIDGKQAAARLRARLASGVTRLREASGFQPGLAVVLVGDDPASQVYVRSKGKQTREIGMASFEHRLPADIPEAKLLALIDRLNADDAVHGILVQLPLPRPLDEGRVIERLLPEKDVDGLTTANSGRLLAGLEGVVPCTPLGSYFLARDAMASLGSGLEGKHAVVIGRSKLVGKPLGLLLLRANMTVTMCHSRTHDLPLHCRRADVLIPAVGRPEMVKGGWVREGAVVIDVGINRVAAPEKGPGKTRLVGDVAFDAARQRAAAITPVPGGVGPMTIACLLRNTLETACRQKGLALPDLG